jgi:hypothetical protein
MANFAERLARMTAAASEPILSEPEINDLLSMFAKVDKDGLLPTEDDWKPTYNLRAAAAEGWRWKSAKAAELISSDLDGDRMSSNQLFEHCQRMIKTYASSASPVVRTANTGKYETLAEVFFEDE